MKNFFGAFFGSCLGVLLTFGLMFLVMIFAIKGLEESIKGDADDEVGTEITKEGILKIELNGTLSEREFDDNPLENLGSGFSFSENKGAIGLNKIRKCLENAAANEKVKGILLIFKNLEGGMASHEEFRYMLTEFRKNTSDKKPLWAYAENYGHGSYYLASACHKIFLHPQGDIRWTGLSAQIMFFREMLEKLGIEVQVFRHGKFKSAVEPFILDKMSDENRRQYESFLNAIWKNMLDDISSSRKIPVDSLQQMANHLSVKNPVDALKKGLVDDLTYWDEAENEIRTFLKLKDNEKIHYLTRNSVQSWINPDKKPSSEKIAVIYAVGGIEGGEGDNETIGSEGLVKYIRKAAENEKVKAIVLRVNSPGGSALASDVIWREIVRAKKKKPIVVSMGDYAASGGYYISCAANKIFAQKNTITGSIGVFGMIPNVSKLLKDKAGIYTDTVNTNRFSDLGGIYRNYTDKEKAFIQASVENVYDVFITRVSEGRNISKSQVDSIGQGRVWSGMEGKNIGLVDAFGGIKEAVEEAAKLANTKQFNLIEYPEYKSIWTKFLGNQTSQDDASVIIKLMNNRELKDAYKTFGMIKKEQKGIWAWWPYQVRVN